MSDARKYILTIGGFDPCNGAGITADVKTAEAIGVYALSVQTCVTIQNDQEIRKLYWHSFQQIKEQIDVLIDQYFFEYIKLSLTNGLRMALEIITYLQRASDAKIIWDPVMHSSSGYEFYSGINVEILQSVLEKVYLSTPNWEEMQRWDESKNPTIAASKFAKISNIFLKGGHNVEAIGTDYLFYDKGKIQKLPTIRISEHSKHGTGCVLSTAVAAYLTKGFELIEACQKAKEYTFSFMESSTSILGEHHEPSRILETENIEPAKQPKLDTKISLEPSLYYHIYNRGNNEENIFIDEENYVYFISLTAYHISPIADILAYCLLPNHLHFVLKIKEVKEIPTQFADNLSLPFSHLFNGYTKAINKKYNKTGNLFQQTFKIQAIDSQEHLLNYIINVHTNAAHHHKVADFKDYLHTSYNLIKNGKDRLVDKAKCIGLFEEVKNFTFLHERKPVELDIDFEENE